LSIDKSINDLGTLYGGLINIAMAV